MSREMTGDLALTVLSRSSWYAGAVERRTRPENTDAFGFVDIVIVATQVK